MKEASISDQEFVRTQVAHRLGKIDEVQLTSTAATWERLKICGSGGTLLWLAAQSRPADWNNWSSIGPGLEGVRFRQRAPELNPKAFRSLQEILAAGADFDFAVDMQDRRVRSPAVQEGPEKGTATPVFAFNRLGRMPGVVLWPLPGYHDLGSNGFLGNFGTRLIPWEDKQDRFVWRGSPGGRNTIGKTFERDAGYRMRPLLVSNRDGKLSDKKLLRHLDQFPRYRFVSRYIDDPRGDVGFTDRKDIGIDNWPVLRSLKREHIPQPEMLQYKYIVVLRGLDIGSSFYWTMNSGSVGLVMETPFESFASIHFRAWEHYVPFREDGSDFEERLEWCLANDAECQAIADRAGATCRNLARTDLREEIDRRVVGELRRRIQAARI
ncbi:MAG TPA: hypothetical protein GXX24_15490 [Paracoccus solventivorans]|uniref:Glycosyl transferase CAP10 domain-containing protein n=1 Tax=Paracoccus solventivorans TaxID=53463 RepID=A0A832QYU9_9RHOB|nr:glycosyl transferase family 90 [Paracoccus solventivorans]HHW35520.1 hypothetical protein [Paracoccus solventivorans]